VPIQNFVGNSLLLGTTRCGKTRMLELIVEMAISLG
jgi:conjugal transfer pilus assembly protein TraD